MHIIGIRYIYRNLKNKIFLIENHFQPKFKLIEQIDYYTDSDFDWNIIEEIENNLN